MKGTGVPPPAGYADKPAYDNLKTERASVLMSSDEVGMIDEPRREVIPRPEELAELDRQWAAIKEGKATIPHAKVLRWLQTWGTTAFRPWKQRGLPTL
jgi:hypothetical protein